MIGAFTIWYLRIRSTFATGFISHLAQGLSVSFILQSTGLRDLKLRSKFVPKSLQGFRTGPPLCGVQSVSKTPLGVAGL